jgi:hypothetical protein
MFFSFRCAGKYWLNQRFDSISEDGQPIPIPLLLPSPVPPQAAESRVLPGPHMPLGVGHQTEDCAFLVAEPSDMIH